MNVGHHRWPKGHSSRLSSMWRVALWKPCPAEVLGTEALMLGFLRRVWEALMGASLWDPASEPPEVWASLRTPGDFVPHGSGMIRT